jgi:hypothetical protein
MTWGGDNEGLDSALTARGLTQSDLESAVRSTLLFGGSAPVSFSGEARLKIQEHDFSDFPQFIEQDRSWTSANWEGNESLIRLGMVVKPNRNAVLWSKIGFQSTLPGNFTGGVDPNPYSNAEGFERSQTRHDKMEETVNIHEDMSAGIAVRTQVASFWLRMGNVLWTEASPLTIWKSQPRTFAWDYLPFEIEQPVSRYYEYNVARGEKAGRAAWHKKAFNGLNLESSQLPYGLQFNILWGTFERYDNFEREYMDFSNDLGFAGATNESKQRGIGDSYRHVTHVRLAKEKAWKDLTIGVNYVGIDYQHDIVDNALWRATFKVADTTTRDSLHNRDYRILNGEGFYKEPKIASLDARGDPFEWLTLHADFALSQIDTVWGIFDQKATVIGQDSLGDITEWTLDRKKVGSSSDIVPAFYLRVENRKFANIRADVAIIPKGFYSPFSFAAPVDAFFPFASNLVGAGKFIARGEGSPYTQNMAGINLSYLPEIDHGHFRLTYGQHMQLESARDVIFFPYRLNGSDLNSAFHSSYNRWGNGLVDHSLTGKYRKRLGDESYRLVSYQAPYGPEAGGLRSDYLSMYDGFVPYPNAASADSNLSELGTISSRSSWVPMHKKWTFNLEMDAAWDFGPKIGYPRDLFLGGYLSLNGVSAAPKAVAFNEKDMMLWGVYARLEPVIALTSNFYCVALLGYENWRAENAYSVDPESGIAADAPINYVDLGAGFGFDWDFSQRVGLHTRLKWLSHSDESLPENDWNNRIASAEIKMWF